MPIGKTVTRKHFWMISLILCLGTGIGVLFHTQNASFFNTVKISHPKVWNTTGDGNSSRLKNGRKCSLLMFHIQSDHKNATIDEQNAIFKQFKKLNDSYALRLFQSKPVVYEDKSKFTTTIAPSTDIGSHDNVTSHNTTVSSSNDTKLILLWTQFFGMEHWIRTKEFKNCKSSCVVTTNKDELSNSAAVMMHSLNLRGLWDLPKTRQPNQRWIYHVMESSAHININLREFNNIWNMTFTYRSDSDLFGGYGSMGPRYIPIADQTFREKVNNLVNSKTKLVAARISNCESESTSRIEYIRELQRHIDVDFYGACGDLTCPKGEQRCETELMKKYKFILAFENSNCRDYITEKFWRALRTWDSVPVVMGGTGVGDYLRVAPSYSFIDVRGFESPKQLAEYLRFMNVHPDYYALLHYWRRYYERKENDRCPFCDLLHNRSAYGQIYTDFYGWYNQDSCKHG